MRPRTKSTSIFSEQRSLVWCHPFPSAILALTETDDSWGFRSYFVLNVDQVTVKKMEYSFVTNYYLYIVTYIL